MQTQLTTPTFGDERLPARFWAKVRIGSVPAHRPDLGPCWEWIGAQSQGYGRFSIGSRTDRSRRMAPAPRFAYEMLVGLIPDGLEPDHLCHNRACVRPTHLEPVTPTVNKQRGTACPPVCKGEAHRNAKLRATDIPIIRALRGKVRQAELAQRYGVSHSTISLVQLQRLWTHIP